MANFASHLREAMGDMSQSDLAARTGINQGVISRLLSGKAKPSYDTTIILERHLPRLRELRLKATA